MSPDSIVVIVMGVAGSGKTTVGALLAGRLGAQFHDADEFHSVANRDKMASGTPLSDEDRGPWLNKMRMAIGEWLSRGGRHVLACSALKAKYRHILAGGDEQVRLVYLQITRTLAEQRVASRSGHYMKSSLTESQFAALEEPTSAEALIISADQEPAAIVDEVCSKSGWCRQ